MTSTSSIDREISINTGLKLKVPGLGTSSCTSSCRSHKKPVHLYDGNKSCNEKISRFKILTIVRSFCSDDRQYEAILKEAEIISGKKEHLTFKQMKSVVNIFHNILQKPSFPNFDTDN